jgi:hypothetical protein
MMRTSVSSGRAGQPTVELLEARSAIAVLTAAHRQSLRLARELLVAQELADAQEHRADLAIAAAIANPCDSGAIDRAVRRVDLSEAAYDDEGRATERWGQHVLHVYGLLAATERLVPGPDGFELTARPKSSVRRIDRSCAPRSGSSRFRR